MRILLGELRRLISEALDPSVEDAIDALPALDAGAAASHNGSPDNVVDIRSVFKHGYAPKVFGFYRKSWLKLAVRAKLPAEVLIPVQDYVYRDGIKRYVENPPKELPLVVLSQGKYYAQDHTRICAQIMQGKSTIDVRLIEHVDGDPPYRRPQV
jgi:hypothetical protein